MQSLKRVLISVFDKRRLTELGHHLARKGAKVLSTGGTLRHLRQHVPELNVQSVSLYTKHPECLGGCVKSLHPRIHAGILADRDKASHRDELAALHIDPIDMVIVNLYPFERVLASGEQDDAVLRENIDIGGPTLLRAAAKNHPHVTVVCDPNDYTHVMNGAIDTTMRRTLAAKAFHHVTAYDMTIAQYMNPSHRYRAYLPVRPLKYGLNPQQCHAGVYRSHKQSNCPFNVLNGNPGYINMLDATYSWQLVSELETLTASFAVASFKHTSPAGVALDTGNPLSDAERALFMLDEEKDASLSRSAVTFLRARFGDPKSSFGDFVAVSGTVDVDLARMLKREVSDGIVARDYEPDALALLKTKKRGNYVILKGTVGTTKDGEEVREMHGVTLIQDANMQRTTYTKLLSRPTCAKAARDRIASGLQLYRDDAVARDLILANTTLKYTQSNSVCAAVDGQVIGVGAGQQSRVDCTQLVKRKAQQWQWMRRAGAVLIRHEHGTRSQKINAVIALCEKDAGVSNVVVDGNVCLASDAFFPFPDCIHIAASFGVRHVVQPGGSVGDKKVQAACDQHNIRMVLTGRDMRLFLH